MREFNNTSWNRYYDYSEELKNIIREENKMLSNVEFDTEKHDLYMQIAELQKQLECLNKYNSEFTAIKSMARSEIITIFSKFLDEIENVDKYNNIFDIDKILTFAYEIENIITKENKNG